MNYFQIPSAPPPPQVRYSVVVVLPVEYIAAERDELESALDIIRQYGSVEIVSAQYIGETSPDYVFR